MLHLSKGLFVVTLSIVYVLNVREISAKLPLWEAVPRHMCLLFGCLHCLELLCLISCCSCAESAWKIVVFLVHS